VGAVVVGRSLATLPGKQEHSGTFLLQRFPDQRRPNLAGFPAAGRGGTDPPGPPRARAW